VVAPSHSHFHAVPFAAPEPLCMVAFCGWVVQQLLTATGEQQGVESSCRCS
jgi:hypothetical protein